MSSSLRMASSAFRSTMAARRTFQTARPLFVKESAMNHEGRAEEIEQKKQEQLREQKQGKGEWKDALASDSESAVKADRQGGESISKMQEETAKKAEKEKK